MIWLWCGCADSGEDAAFFEYHMPSLVALMTTIEDQERQQSQQQQRKSAKATRAASEHGEDQSSQVAAVHGYLTGLLWVLELYLLRSTRHWRTL